MTERGTTPITIRRAEVADLDSMVEIHDDAVRAGATGHGDPIPVEDRQRWLAERPENRPVLVAIEGDIVAGFAELSDYRPGRRAFRAAVEISYFVHSGHRRKGIATALIRRCIELCPDLGIRNLIAILLEDNHASIRLLEKLSFERWGHLPRVAELGGRELDHLYYGLRVP